MSPKVYNIQLQGSPEKVLLRREHYHNGRVALSLVCLDGKPYATATINLPDEPMEPKEVAIKNYSENEGMLSFLIENKIVNAPHRFVTSGYVTVPICKLKEVK